jgi:LmbE family N-acetylglucosaminyl deacetylase
VGGAAAALGALAGPGIAGAAKRRGASPRGRSVVVTAHPDDPLLFLSPDLLKDVQQSRPVVVAFLTAGDAGRGTAYWQGREAGVLAAVAEMVGVPNSWNPDPAVIGSHTIAGQSLSGAPTVSVLFFRLPDGNPKGTGYAITGNQSLQNLWNGTLSAIDAIDGSTSYTSSDLEATLATLITQVNPLYVRTQDYVGSYGGGDHSDHYSTAYLTKAAATASSVPVTALSYVCYPGLKQPVNLGRQVVAKKVNAYLAYAPDDPAVPQTQAELQSEWNGDYYGWLSRQYVASTDQL